MWTQRDQLQAYQFLRRRLVSALQVADANHPVSPSRRVIACGVIGAVVMLLIAAGFGIYGLLRPGANSNWRKPGQVVIEKESGAPYVLLDDNKLHPVLNYTSARLLAGGNGTATARVSAKSLRSAPRGVPVGIPGAPEAPPPLADMLAGPWTVCSQLSADRPASDPATTVITLGVSQVGRQPGPNDALLVRQGNTRYVLTGGRRLKVADNETLLALGLQKIPPTPVTAAWISTVPAGPDLRLILINGAGQPGPRVGAKTTRVGQVLVVEHVNTAPSYYVVFPKGVTPVSQMEAILVWGNPRNKAAYPDGPGAVRVGAADIAAVDTLQRSSSWPDYPQQAPAGRKIDSDQVAVCATALPGGGVVIHIATVVPLPPSGKLIEFEGGGDDVRIADQAYIPPGRGAVVVEQRPSGAVVGAEYLVTDQGIRFPLGKDARKALGLGRARRVGVPATMLALLPIGPTLDTKSAAKEVKPDSPGADDTTEEPAGR